MAEKNTYVDFELEDGTTVKLTLQFYRLYMLKNTNKKAVYDRYNKINAEGFKEELDMVDVLYTAYLCANVKEIDTCMTREEFLMNMPVDREYIGDTYNMLVNPKKTRLPKSLPRQNQTLKEAYTRTEIPARRCRGLLHILCGDS